MLIGINRDKTEYGTVQKLAKLLRLRYNDSKFLTVPCSRVILRMVKRSAGFDSDSGKFAGPVKTRATRTAAPVRTSSSVLISQISGEEIANTKT